jgi:hypothetical protein
MQPSYTWTLSVPDGSKATLTGANTASPTFVADQPGAYVAQLIVNDGMASAPSTTTVTAGPVVTSVSNGSVSPKPPVANAGPDQSVTVGATVTLDARASTSAGATQLKYAWTLTTVPNGSQATVTDANTESPTFLADQPGVYVAQLIVNDGLPSTSSTTTVTAS